MKNNLKVYSLILSSRKKEALYCGYEIVHETKSAVGIHEKKSLSI